ncbi:MULTISPECIES: hypothetical protein [unclassified Rhizobium]|uniref:hypothetical protein n=1 Tax=unclassified Rhizobium TaxID=2613769 RepID=UPI00115D6EED|nr:MULTISPECIES: hypothetical protein [unclassified Rhizobium]TQX88448.1 hypothetical protein EQW76_11465 [Rhizobium sp. rho-13.1]TQY12643.1 hypothetical protein EQW74_15110 [Rhizobium sp. rho-1.1]
MHELSLENLSGLLEFIAYQGKTGDGPQRALSVDVLRAVIETLPSQAVTVEDVVTLHALAISLAKSGIASVDDPEAAKTLLGYLVTLLTASGNALEYFTGVPIGDRRFFDDMTPTTIQ